MAACLPSMAPILDTPGVLQSPHALEFCSNVTAVALPRGGGAMQFLMPACSRLSADITYHEPVQPP